MSRVPGSLEVEHDGLTITLLSERAVWLPAAHALLVADLHWGKDTSFRRHGIAVPRGDLDLELAQLARAVERTTARVVYVLGDLIHDRVGVSAEVERQVGSARSSGLLAGVDMVLVRGNHDRRLPRMPEAFGVEEVFEPHTLACDGHRIALAHEPDALAECPQRSHGFAGHLHPTVRLRVSRGGDDLRLACFHVGGRDVVLPAFCLFTGGPPIVRRPGERVFAIAENHVVEV